MKLTKFKPSLGRVYILPLPEEERTASGLYLPNRQGQVSATVGTVVEICESYRSADDDDDRAINGPLYPVGTVVVIGKWSGTEIEIGNKRHLIINESDVLGTLHEEQANASS